MALPRIDTPIYELTLPLSQKRIKFRPFLVKEQKNLMMAIEADDKETIERNVKQVLHNCTLTENVDIEKIPAIDVEYYLLQLRARSVGEIIESKYICNNVVNDEKCGNKMNVTLNLIDVEVTKDPNYSDIIEIGNNLTMKMKYPEFSTIEKIKEKTSSVDIAFEIIADSIEYIFDGTQYYYAVESTPKELKEFVEQLNAEQFSKIEKFFEHLPKLNKKVEIKCNKCGYDHSIEVEGLQNFFG